MKKRLLSVLVCICMVAALLPATVRAEEITTISTLDELKAFRDSVNNGTDYSGKTVELKADIDLGGSAGNQWTPIGTESNPFKGTFDGGGHKITGLYIDAASENLGLFGYVGGVDEFWGLPGESSDVGESGTVKNLGVDGSVTGSGRSSSIGGVVGGNKGTVLNCYNTGAVTGGTTVGGVVGFNGEGGTVSNCYNTGTVSSSNTYIGGVIGNSSGTVINCYNTGEVKGGSTVGGVAGMSTKAMTNCYNAGMVTGSQYVGGVIGNFGGTATACYYLQGTATKGIARGDGDVKSKTAEDFKVQNTFNDWNFTDVWIMSSVLGRPILAAIPESDPSAHSHRWDTAWTQDENSHWHECDVSGCPVTDNSKKDGYGQHVGKWVSDDPNQHWQICETCGWTGERAVHIWDEGEVTIPPTSSAEGIKTYTCTVCTAVKTEAVSKLTFAISGQIKDHDDAAVPDATVKLLKGRTVVGTAATDSQGNYSFTGVETELYNVVAEKTDGAAKVTKSIVVKVIDTNAAEKNIKMPGDKKNSVVEVQGDVTSSAADTL